MAKKKKAELEEFDARMSARIEVLEREKSISFLDGYAKGLALLEDLQKSIDSLCEPTETDSHNFGGPVTRMLVDPKKARDAIRRIARDSVAGLKRNNREDDVEAALKMRRVNPDWR